MRSGLWPGFVAFFVYLLSWTSAFKHLDIFNDLDLGVQASAFGLALLPFVWPLAWLYCLFCLFYGLDLGVQAFGLWPGFIAFFVYFMFGVHAFRTSRRVWHPRRSFRQERLRTYPDISIILDFSTDSSVLMLYFESILVQDRHVDMLIRSRSSESSRSLI